MIITSPMRCGTNWLGVSMVYLAQKKIWWRKLKGLGSAMRRTWGDVPARVRELGHVIIWGHPPLELLAPLAEERKIVCLVRDRRDTIVSLAYRRIRTGRSTFAPVLARQWADGGEPDMRDWWDSYAKARRHVPHLLVRYEDMLTQPHEEFLRVWDHLELSAASGLPRPDTARLVAVLERLSQGVSKSSPRRRGIAGEWREHFSGDEGAAFYDKHMAATAHLGYSRR